MDAVTKMIRRAMNARFVGSDGAMTVGKPKKPTVAEQFGAELRKTLDEMGLTREQFAAEAVKVFVDLHDKTPERWYEGKTLPQKESRGWFFHRFKLKVPSTRELKSEIRVPESKPAERATASDLMAYAVGSLQTAIKATDDQIVHDVRDSLKDPQQSPWMRIAVTLVRNAHRRD